MELHDIFRIVAVVSGIFLAIGGYSWLEFSANSGYGKKSEIQRAQAVVDAGNPKIGMRGIEYWVNVYYLKAIRNFGKFMLVVAILFIMSVVGLSFA